MPKPIDYPCTICGLANPSPRVSATAVATAADGMQWFECDLHGPTDHPCGFARVASTPLSEWLGIFER